MKHVVIVALVVALVLLIAAPLAAGFPATSGARVDYDNVFTSPGDKACNSCHATPDTFLGVVPKWAGSLHAQIGSATDDTVNAIAISEGPGCAGCHSGNYDPSKAQGALEPGPTATPTVYPVIGPLQTPDPGFAYSEPFVGCSACHGSKDASHSQGAQASGMGYGAFANPEICGQCHSRYAKTVATYTYTPYPTATAASTIQPQYAVGFDPLGTTSLASVLNIPLPGAPVGNVFWPDPITASGKAHGEGAVQYEECVQNLFTGDPAPPSPSPTPSIPVTHFNALKSLIQTDPQDHFVTASGCLECHSADYQIIQRWNENSQLQKTEPTLLTAKYGDTCVTCHDPHAKGDQESVFNPERNPQLVAPQAQLCTKCHNTEVPADQNGQVAAGEEIHHPQQEMMAGTSLTSLGVPDTPSVHKGDCVQCHMVPTGIEFNGVPGTAGNHLFKVITPEYAATHVMTISGRTGPMPNSACGQCHSTPTDNLARYLQPVLDARQTLFDQQTTTLASDLDTAAIGIGYVDAEDAAADVGEPADPSSTNPSVMAFLSAETIYEFVTQDSSRGIHNWSYTERAIDTANAWLYYNYKPIPFTVTLKASKTSVNAGTKITLSGTVSSPSQSAGKTLYIQKKSGSSWKNIASVKVATGDPNGTYKYTWKVTKGKNQQLRAKFGPYTFSGVTRPVGYSKIVKVTGK